MQFENAVIKGIKADVAKGDITISFTVSMNQLEAAEELSNFTGKDASDVNMAISPRQISMKLEAVHHA